MEKNRTTVFGDDGALFKNFTRMSSTDFQYLLKRLILPNHSKTGTLRDSTDMLYCNSSSIMNVWSKTSVSKLGSERLFSPIPYVLEGRVGVGYSVGST
nr:unnamed protein product [Callosobruchus chinensis]